jgi:signal transduction histidine kinase
MNPTLKLVLHAGVSATTPESRARAIILCNTIALIAVALSSVFLIYYALNGWGRNDSIIFGAIVVISSIPFLNFLGMTNVSRFLLPLVLPIASMAILMMVRIQQPERFSYIRSPGIFCVILTTAVIPVLVFSTREKRMMLSCLAVNFILFASLDPLLRYYSVLHTLPSAGQYISANLSMLITYMLLVASVMSLKEITDDYELKNVQLIQNLNKKNDELEKANLELHELNKNIETQNEEIQAQSEELIQSQDSLILANRQIERQNLKLEQQNELLSKTLDEKSNDLLLTNQQLVAHNNELQQFSYTISHNLRGPVASMLGLINIYHHANTPEEGKQILTLLQQSTESLETVIRDLNKIIDIRNDKFSIFEDFSLEHELNLIKKTLNPFIRTNEAHIESDFQVDQVTSVKAYINSILYNLISNAIQYRAFDRKPEIRISSRIFNDHILLEVSDNGLGIDLTKFSGELFKLYKRFHTHTQGKGLGLYLVKQQVEKLNGQIEIESKPDEGSTFRIRLPLKMQVP